MPRYWNLVNKTCDSCPLGTNYDTSQKLCTACENGQKFDFTKFMCVNITLTVIVTPVITKPQIPACPSTTPFWDGKQCVSCYLPKYWNSDNKTCESCP